jgi:hypothetical protein
MLSRTKISVQQYVLGATFEVSARRMLEGLSLKEGKCVDMQNGRVKIHHIIHDDFCTAYNLNTQKFRSAKKTVGQKLQVTLSCKEHPFSMTYLRCLKAELTGKRTQFSMSAAQLCECIVENPGNIFCGNFISKFNTNYLLFFPVVSQCKIFVVFKSF